MGFYFRKSFGNGPFRINFSKSGISYSLGVKGARLNFNKRGTYVNIGANGIYYRKKISGTEVAKVPKKSEKFPTSHNEQHTITSGDLEKITDIDSQDFINELTEKNKKISFYKWFGVIPFIISLVVLFFIFFYNSNRIDAIETIETKEYVKSKSTSNINIRKKPDPSGAVLGVMIPGEQFELLDSSNIEWFKIKYLENEGFISRKFTEKITERITKVNEVKKLSKSVFITNKRSFWLLLISITIMFSFLLPYLKKIDRKRMLVEINYDIDDNIKDIYLKFVNHFSSIFNCSRVWQYLHSENTGDYKYSSGASHTVTRKLLTNISKNNPPLKYFWTNVEIPYLGLINTELYFFPERLIIKRGNEFGAIMYKNIQCYGNTTSFIESESVPNDSIIIGHTWRYLNKNGSPDRRFSNNYQIPICQYNEYSFKSNSGLNEKIATSRTGVFDEFLRYIQAVGQLQKHYSHSD